jgi:nitrite reductase/ring-hydroxylating ferredoxin subunit
MSNEGWLDAGSNELEDGAANARVVGHHQIMVVRQGETIHVVDAICPHKFALLTEGFLGAGCISCPQHEATFDLATGYPGEGESWAGRLPVHEARIEGDRLLVRLASN